MILLKKQKTKKKRQTKKFFLFLKFYFITTFIIFSFLLYYISTSWTLKSTVIKLKDSLSKAGRYEMIYYPKILYNSILGKFQKIDKLNLNISYENELKLESYRSQAIKDNVLSPMSTASNIKVKFEHNGIIYNAKIRLKGGRTTHWNKKKNSSYKVELENNQFLFGLNKFSLSKPKMRNYIYEWLFHEMGKEFDIISLDYKFVNLSINGHDYGLYVIEEGFDKRLIENSGRRNGPIFSLNEELNMNFNTIDKSANSIFEVYNKNYWLNDKNITLTKYASDKLNNLFLGKFNQIENVINFEKWSSFLAICDFLYTFHGAQFKSVRFYYNPIDGLFEPVLYDGHRGRNHPNYNTWNQNYNNQIIFDYIYNHSNAHYEDNSLKWLKLFLDDEKFKKLYFEKLNKITSEKFLIDFYKSRKNEIKKINNKIYGDYYLFDNGDSWGPGFYFFSIDDFFYRQKKIKEKISFDEKITNMRFQAGIENNKDLIIKNFVRPQYYGLYEIQKLICDKVIDLKDNNDQYKIINYLINDKFRDDELKKFDFHSVLINTKIDLSKFDEDIIKTCKSVEIYNTLNQKKWNLNIDKLNFNITDTNTHSDDGEFKKYFLIKKNQIYLKNNIQIIDKYIYIPEKYSVIIKSGQKIILKDNAFIFSKANWIVDGSNKPIEISGLAENFGGGIFINSSKKNSYFNNVNFRYLSGLKKDKLNNHLLILGSINFYNTTVDLNNLKFEEITSEDALNIVSSNFKINNIQFNLNMSDSIDFDFSDGKISDVSFNNIGNDAIDFSGSIVDLENASFKNIGDKMISIGENSDLKIKNINGTNSFIGIATKDGSNANAEEIYFDQVKYPFASYIKKSEYGIPTLNIENYKVFNFTKKWITDSSSKIISQNKNFGIKTSDILSLIYKDTSN